MENTATTVTELTKGTEQIAHLSENERLVLLSAKRRRFLLEILSDQTSPVDLEDLAVEVAKREDDLDPSKMGDVKGVEIMLFHQHLPKMADFDVLDFDPDRQQISL